MKPSIRPAAAAEAIAAARLEIGDDDYERLRQHGAEMLAADFDDFLVTAVAGLHSASGTRTVRPPNHHEPTLADGAPSEDDRLI